MRDALKLKQKLIEQTLGDARELALLRAFAASKGMTTEIPVPSVKTREVTAEDKLLVTSRRVQVSELIWLHHERDAVCVETGLIPEQVAAILAMATRIANVNANGNGHGNETSDVAQVPRSRTAQPTITADPATWPVRPVESGGMPNMPPKSREVAADADDVDHQIVCAVWHACGGGKGDWDNQRKLIASTRRLWPHSIAGMVARSRYLGVLPKVQPSV